MIEQCPVGITLVMDRSGTKTMTNLRGQRLFGRSFPRDTETAAYAMLVHTPDGRPLTLPRDAQPAGDARRSRAAHRGAPSRPDGRQIPSLINAAALVDTKGEVQGAVVVFEDITPQKELERLRSEWSSIVAHDLRQPLNAIAIHAQLIAMGAPALEAPLTRISQAVGRLNRMVQDLLDLSQLEARRMVLTQQNVDLQSLVDRSIDLVAAGTGRPFEVRVQGEPPRVTVDADRIAQVLDNLLTNAVKYGAAGTPIVVTIDATGPEIGVAVTNEGAGVDPEDVPHLFNRFYRVEGGRRVKGVGLGLYIARELVEAHGGRMPPRACRERRRRFDSRCRARRRSPRGFVVPVRQRRPPPPERSRGGRRGDRDRRRRCARRRPPGLARLLRAAPSRARPRRPRGTGGARGASGGSCRRDRRERTFTSTMSPSFITSVTRSTRVCAISEMWSRPSVPGQDLDERAEVGDALDRALVDRADLGLRREALDDVERLLHRVGVGSRRCSPCRRPRRRWRRRSGR